MNPFVLSLSKHRSSLRARRQKQKTALRQAQGERIHGMGSNLPIPPMYGVSAAGTVTEPPSSW